MQIRKPLFDTHGHKSHVPFKDVLSMRRLILRRVYDGERQWLEFRWRQLKGIVREETLLFSIYWRRG